MRSGLLVVLVACGGDSGGLTAHDGVYTIDTWTRNDASCDAEGASIADTLPAHFFIKNESFFGETFINVNLCPSIDECTADARDDETLHIGQWGFQTGNDADGFTDESAFAFENAGTCEATRVQATLTFTGDTMRLEERVRFGSFAPTGTDCPDDAAVAATADAPCEELEVLAATFTTTF